jgi:hypothetical protein
MDRPWKVYPGNQPEEVVVALQGDDAQTASRTISSDEAAKFAREMKQAAQDAKPYAKERDYPLDASP